MCLIFVEVESMNMFDIVAVDLLERLVGWNGGRENQELHTGDS
jgi:hypothetical protein